MPVVDPNQKDIDAIMEEINLETKEMVGLILASSGWGEIKITIKSSKIDEIALSFTRKKKKNTV